MMLTRHGLGAAAMAVLLAGCATAADPAPPPGDPVVAEVPPTVTPPATQNLLDIIPDNRNVLLWPQEARGIAFRALDGFPALAQARTIAAGGTVRALPMGAPLDLGAFDLGAFMDSQQSAAIVVLLDGEIVLERYGLGMTPQDKWTSFSVAKSLTSTLVGAAMADGHIESLDDPVTRYVEDLRGSAYDDVTVRQLLTMRSGVAWDENYASPTSDVARFNEHVAADGLDVTVSYMRGLERAHPPGEVWNYSTGETNLVGVLVEQATGSTLADYLSEKVWQPFGMAADASWLLGSTGTEIAGCCIQATTRDMARFGQFVLEDGVASGRRMVPQGWFDEATSAVVRLGDSGNGYGYQWWTYDEGTFAAGGIFGQGIFIDPARNLVVAVNANWATANGQAGEGRERFRFYQAVRAAVDAR